MRCSLTLVNAKPWTIVADVVPVAGGRSTPASYGFGGAEIRPGDEVAIIQGHRWHPDNAWVGVVVPHPAGGVAVAPDGEEFSPDVDEPLGPGLYVAKLPPGLRATVLSRPPSEEEIRAAGAVPPFPGECG